MAGAEIPRADRTSPSSPAGPSSLTIAVPTYRRPELLAVLLPLLLGQLDTVTDLASDLRDLEVLVIDNDPPSPAGGGGALDRVAQVLAELGDPRVRLVAEPTPGVVAVRNRALDETAGRDLVVFIDDDERPEPGWLAGLLGLYLRERPAAVAGPVVSVLPAEVDDWIRAGGFFDRRHRHGLATGTALPEAATNNLLLDRAVVDRWALRFDNRFALSGGEDSLFTRELHRAGERLLWCAEARVAEDVPAARLTRDWVSRRALSLANSEPRVRLALARGRRGRARVRGRAAGRGAVRVLGGTAGLAVGLLARSPARRARGVRAVYRGVGLLAGAAGFSYVEYGRSARRWSWDPVEDRR